MIDLKWLKSTQNLTGSPLSGEKLPVATNIGKGRISQWLLSYFHQYIFPLIIKPVWFKSITDGRTVWILTERHFVHPVCQNIYQYHKMKFKSKCSPGLPNTYEYHKNMPYSGVTIVHVNCDAKSF